MRLVTMGGLRLEGASLSRPKPLLLLAYLTLEGARDRRFLAELFWRNSPSPLANLRTSLSQLRLGAPGSVTTSGGKVSSTVDCDALKILARLDRQEPLEDSLLHTEPFLDGVYLPDWSAELEEWVYGTREHLAELIRFELLSLARDTAALGDRQEAAILAERALFVRGAREPDVNQLETIYQLLLAGNSVHAERLRREAVTLGVELKPERADAASPSSHAGPSSAYGPFGPSVMARTASRADFFVGRESEKREIAALLCDEGTRVVTLLGPGGVGKTSLAVELASNAGSTVTSGAPAYLVPLEAVADPHQIPEVIAASLGLELPDTGDGVERLAQSLGKRPVLLVVDNFERLVGGAGIIARLVRSCPRVQVLVTSREPLHIDEEVIYRVDGLPFPVDDTRSPQELTRVDAVQLFLARARRVMPRYVPSDEDLVAIGRVCRLLAGSPLAIEMAAGTLRVMEPKALAGQLRTDLGILSTRMADRPERQRSLRTSFEYSWRLLPDSEKLVLASLAPFRGGFSREAAAAVAQATIPQLASLVDASFLRVGDDGRFRRHPLVGSFLDEKLTELPDVAQEVYNRYVHFHVQLAEEFERHVRGAQTDALTRLDRELGNLRQALELALTSVEPLMALRLGAAVWRYWHIRGYWDEGRGWLKRILSDDLRKDALALAPGVARACVKVLKGAGVLASAQGDLDEAKEHYEQALRLSRILNEEALAGELINDLGVVALHQGEYGKAAEHLQSGLAIRRALKDEWGIAASLNNLGALAGKQGEAARAQEFYEESLAIFQKLGNRSATALLLSNLGDVAEFIGDSDLARGHFEASLALQRELGEPSGIAASLVRLAADARRRGQVSASLAVAREALELLVEIGDRERVSEVLLEMAVIQCAADREPMAVTLWSAALALRERIGVPVSTGPAKEYEELLPRLRSRLADDEFRRAWTEGRRLSLEQLKKLVSDG